MKKRLLFVAVLSSIFFFSCSRSSDDDSSNSGVDISTGTWHITLFTDSGNNETSDYDGYIFTFATGGVLTAVKNGVSTNGRWSPVSKFNINLGLKSDSNKPLGELTDNWQIISISANEIKLTDDNSSSGEFLTFTKN
ncbi:MAG: hypothetical protein ABUT20_40900 [Bacteroidota bacterium]